LEPQILLPQVGVHGVVMGTAAVPLFFFFFRFFLAIARSPLKTTPAVTPLISPASTPRREVVVVTVRKKASNRGASMHGLLASDDGGRLPASPILADQVAQHNW
jgi:hypothetical protein